jgi:predicted permease
VQAALSVVLLVGAGLFVRSLHKVRAMDLGFDMKGLLVATTVEDGGGLPVADERRFFDSAIERLGRQPGIAGVAYSQALPFSTSWSYDMKIPGRDSLPTPRSGGPYANAVSRDYLRTMDLRVLRGRGFEDGDFAAGARVLIVDEAFAAFFFPDTEVLGACVQLEESHGEATGFPCSTVVGVAENARRGSVMEEPNPQYYMPATHPSVTGAPYALLVRARDTAPAFIENTRRVLLGLEPRLRYVNIQPLAALTSTELRGWTLGATMFTVFGGLALVVAALGLYSVLAFDVAQRRREIGLRSALGAGTGRLVGIVMGRAVRITAAGLLIGLAGALLLAPRLRTLLYQTSPGDPLTLVGVALVLLLVAIIAGGLPAWRAARVDPNVALRSD